MSVGLNSEGCLDANPKQTGWSLTSRRLYTCFMPLTSFDNYDKSTSLSIAFTCRKKSACESCKMQWLKSWLDCNGLQHVTPLTDGGSSLASFGSCWPSPSWILCNALERQEWKMQGGRKKGQESWLMQFASVANQYWSDLSKNLATSFGRVGVDPSQDMQTLCQSFQSLSFIQALIASVKSSPYSFSFRAYSFYLCFP